MLTRTTVDAIERAQLPVPGRWIGREVFEPHQRSLGLVRCEACRLAYVDPRPGPKLLSAAEHGFEPAGLDIGNRARATCRAQGFAVAAELSELGPASFDAVVLHHVFEHVPDPQATLGDLAKLLSPGGTLFIEVPNRCSLRARVALPLLSQRFDVDERYRAFPIHPPHT